MDHLDRIRAFNRSYTGRMGLLTRSYLGSGLGVWEMRVLHELGQRCGLRDGLRRARTIAQALTMDEAQVSRALAGFERRGWLVRGADPQDARQRVLDLTPAGQAALQRFEQQSRQDLSDRLASLPPAQQQALAEALERAAQLMEGEIPLRLRDLRPGDAGWILSRHGSLYSAHEGFDARFEALVAEILAAFLRNHDPARERGWIACRGDEPDAARLGCLFCMAEGPADPGIARLRMFLVEPEARGSGLAQHMLETCLEFARGAGYRRMRLWTHESHRAAGRLYARNGFALMTSRPAHSFGQALVEQNWERDL